MIAIVIGRFQVPYLHEGHKFLFRSIHAERLVVLLGVTPEPNADNPLSFETRESMLSAELVQLGWENFTILPLRDCESDDDWVDALSELFTATFGTDDWMFYCGRDSGAVRVLEDAMYPNTIIGGGPPDSGTRLRQLPPVNDSREFRRGVIYAWQHRSKSSAFNPT